MDCSWPETTLTVLHPRFNTIELLPSNVSKTPDISIRQRALELIYFLVNHENVEALIAELLNYLVLCPREDRADICSRVRQVVDSYSPDDRWRVDMFR